MKTATYHVIDKEALDEWNTFNTQHKAFRAAKEVNDAGTYDAIVVKVVTEKVAKEFVPSVEVAA